MRKAQAFVELAIGCFALALVLSALFSFTLYIVKSLDIQREARKKAGVAALGSSSIDLSYSSSEMSDKLEVEAFAADYIFGSEEVDIKEKVSIPNMKGF